MKLWMAYTVLGFSLGLIGLLALAGCGMFETPTEGPRLQVENNTAPVTAILTTGSASPANTAPCGVPTSPQKIGDNRGAGGPAPNCSTNTEAAAEEPAP